MLEVPAVIAATDTNHFHLMQGGEIKTVPFPSKPYEWSLDASEEAEEMYVIGMGWQKVGKKYYGKTPTERVGAGRGERVKHDFITQLLLDDPDFFRKHSNKADPFVVFLDIETTSSDGHKSSPDRDEIISAQLKYSNSEPIILEVTSQYSEKDLLKELVWLVHKDPKTGLYPDYIVGFFVNRFDIPFIYKRMVHYHMVNEISKIGRVHQVGHQVGAYYYQSSLDPIRRIGENMTSLSTGIYGFDLSLQTRSDVTLSHLPRKGLKQVVAHYGHQPYDIPDWAKRDMASFRAKYPDKFMKYILSDIEATEFLYRVYEPALIASSNMLGIPIMVAQRASHGFRSTIALYRKERSRKYIGLFPNAERYAALYSRAPKYQGALVGCTRKGYFDKTIYVDCKSMYPNIMHDFNISPDKYTFEGVVDYTGEEKEEYLFGDVTMREIRVEPLEDGRKRVYIPDDNYGAYLVFVCDFENDGYIRELISELNAKRDHFKREAKKYYKKYLESNKTDAEAYANYLMYNSYQNEAKIINNTIYGIQGDKSNKHGDLPAAVFVTAIGRWIMGTMVRYFGDAVLEIDTDGLLLDRSKELGSIEEINRVLRNQIREKFGIPEEKMRFMLEFEGGGSIYLYKAKNYLLRKDEDNSLTIKGSSFKGYDKAKVIREAVEVMANAIMYKTMSYEEAVKSVTNLRGRSIEDFLFVKTVRKLPAEYKDFDNMHHVLYGFDREGKSKREIVRTMKERLLAWVESKVSSDKRRVEINKSIRHAQTEEELIAISAMFSGTGSKRDITKAPVMLQISFDMIKRGRAVEIDDVFEFYWTLTPSRYTLAEDMNESTQLDYERYLKEIMRAIDRFKYADPNYTASLLFDEVPDEAEYYVDSNGGFSNSDEEEETEEEE